MLYSSTRGNDQSVNFVDVLLKGLANDGGLFVPDNFPRFSEEEILEMQSLKYFELVYTVTKEFVEPEIPNIDYLEICKKSYQYFSSSEIISTTKISENEFLLNLYNGPTFAFKDFALQLLGNIYSYILQKTKSNLTILGATSGDTGSAAIYGCSNSDLIKMFILFPLGKVSEIQRRQMTTFEKSNVFNIAVKGDFDQCQSLVKEMFNLNSKKKKYNLAAVNSINWVRILGQIVYYFWSYLNCASKGEKLNFSVPTGNFGNVYAGFIAKKMGLPINKLIVASNFNDVLTRFFETGIMEKKSTLKTLSPSMDIQISSNFERLLYDFYKNDSKTINQFYISLNKSGKFKLKKALLEKILKEFKGGRLSDSETMETIQEIYANKKIIIDPHTAVGLSVGRKIRKKEEKTVYISTAHPGKFLDTINNSLKINFDLPETLKKMLKKDEKFEIIENDIIELSNFIDNRI